VWFNAVSLITGRGKVDVTSERGGRKELTTFRGGLGRTRFFED